MKPLACRCGQVVYFDNHACGSCGRQLAYDPVSLSMQSEINPGAGLVFCSNRDAAIRCNWLANAAGGLCLSCQSSEVIPTLSKPENFDRWRKLETAKRRLLYDLLRLGLPVDANHLRFVFKEDRRTNPDVHEEHVNIGHAEGVITINAAEADEVFREEMRALMNEPYRTLLGHFRHEAGHYYFDMILDDEQLAAVRHLFGDERQAYDEALQRYYREGPQPGWQNRFISTYASAHPAEDWAETWAHYLHMQAALETAVTNGLLVEPLGDDWQVEFVDFMMAVNEVMRSQGLADAYPFIVSTAAAAKIDFVHEAVQRFTNRRGAPAPGAD